MNLVIMKKQEKNPVLESALEKLSHSEVGALVEDFQHKLTVVAENLQGLSGKVDKMDARLVGVESRLERVEIRLYTVEDRLEVVEKNTNLHNFVVNDHENRIGNLEMA